MVGREIGECADGSKGSGCVARRYGTIIRMRERNGQNEKGGGRSHTIAGFARAKASSPASARSAPIMAPASTSEAPGPGRPTLGYSTTNAPTEDTADWLRSSNSCAQPPASFPSRTGSVIYENCLLVVHPANRLRLSCFRAVEGSCLSAWEQGHDASVAGPDG